MNLLDLAVGVVEQVNLLVHHHKHLLDRDTVGRLVQKIEETQALVKDAEHSFRRILKDIEAKEGGSNVVVVTRNKVPVCIVGDGVAKPSLEDARASRPECCHAPSFGGFEPLRRVVHVETRGQLAAIDKTVSQAVVEVFDHTYRSYEGFTCLISVGDTRGNIYIVDAIRFRTAIPKLAMMRCGVPKIVHCSGCAARLLKDFGQLGCFRSYELAPAAVFVDWRIRPVPRFLHETLCQGVRQMAEMADGGVKPRKAVEGNEVDEAKDIVSRYAISDGTDVLDALLKLRRFLAKSNDESVYYVMTDDQLVRLMAIRPATQDELLRKMGRLSPLARQHAMDFLLVFNCRAGGPPLQSPLAPGANGV